MTKKHYEMIARAIKTWRENGACASKKLVSEFIADELEKDNLKFNRERFLQACKVEKSQT